MLLVTHLASFLLMTVLNAPIDFDKAAPFTAVRWVDATTEVQVEGVWSGLQSIDGTPIDELLTFAKQSYFSRWQKRFSEDLVELLSLAGQPPGATVQLVLSDLKTGDERTVSAAMTWENRQLAWDYNNTAPPEDVAPLTAKDAFIDLDMLLATMEEQHSYFKLNEVDASTKIEEIKARLSEDFSKQAFALELIRFLALFGDGHAGLRVSSEDVFEPGFLPFLIGAAGQRYVAFLESREELVDSHHPFLLAIDGVPIAAWVSLGKTLTAHGSLQSQNERGTRNIRYLNWGRTQLGLAITDEVVLTLGGAQGNETAEVTLPVAESKPLYGEWPRTMSGMLDGNVGYLRINEMFSPDEVPDLYERLAGRMDSYRDTRALVIDVRGNGGGTRHVLKTLLPYFLDPAQGPRVVNVAAKRLTSGDDPDDEDGLLGQTRGLFPAHSAQHGPAARRAIVAFADQFDPAWPLPEGDFSPWHYMVIAPTDENGTYFYDRPVAVLIDPSCFSATDVFTGAFKGVPNVTLIGTPTGGGSGRSRPVTLPRSGFSLRLSSMASFQPSGSLYDGVGVAPDRVVYREPGDFIGQTDTVLDAAIAVLVR